MCRGVCFGPVSNSKRPGTRRRPQLPAPRRAPINPQHRLHDTKGTQVAASSPLSRNKRRRRRDRDSPHEPVGRVHGDAADVVVAHVLGDLEDQADGQAVHLEGRLDRGQLAVEAHVHDGADDLCSVLERGEREGRVRVR